MHASSRPRALVPTGIVGLDTILNGGLPKGRIYLVEGLPGVGKTTLGLQFLLAGASANERVMMVSLIETLDELSDVALSHGWNLDPVRILEIPDRVKTPATTFQTVFPPSEVEFGDIADMIVEGIAQFRPDRLLIDSISQLALLMDSWQQLRSSILTLRSLISAQQITTLFTSSTVDNEPELATMVHGKISLRCITGKAGRIQREMTLDKIRGHQYRAGRHDYWIATGGIDVFAWQTIQDDSTPGGWSQRSSGNQALDDLLGGGLESGSACLISGTTGAGKSTMSSLFVQATVEKKDAAVIFCFDENKATYLHRNEKLGIPIKAYIDRGLIDLQEMDTALLTTGKFVHTVVGTVAKIDAKIVVIDSLTGLLSSVPDSSIPLNWLRNLLDWLSRKKIVTILILNNARISNINDLSLDVSYIADAVIILRHFEALGRIRRCIAVLKNRHSRHEHMIREFKIIEGGCQIGPPLKSFNGVLSGNPQYLGGMEKLIDYDA